MKLESNIMSKEALQVSIGAEMVRLQVVTQQKSRVRRPAFFVAASVERGSWRR
jgi:hypothetical protein